MDRLPYAGQMATLSGDATSFVTDSAAAATAIATGVKTLNGSVSIDLKGQEQMTILELARTPGGPSDWSVPVRLPTRHLRRSRMCHTAPTRAK